MADKLSALFAKKDKKKKEGSNINAGDSLTGEVGGFSAGAVRIVTTGEVATISVTDNVDVDIGHTEISANTWKSGREAPPALVGQTPVVATSQPAEEGPKKFQARKAAPKKVQAGLNSIEWASLDDQPGEKEKEPAPAPAVEPASTTPSTLPPSKPGAFVARGKDGATGGAKAPTVEKPSTEPKAEVPSDQPQKKAFVARGKEGATGGAKAPTVEQPSTEQPPEQAKQPEQPQKKAFVARGKEGATGSTKAL
eukprot:PhF_6_TR29472/c1_g1_i2/m.43666